MNHKTTLLVASGIVIIIALIAALYFMKSGPASSPPDLSSFGTDNPLDKKPDMNPTDKTNPFSNIKTNPFE